MFHCLVIKVLCFCSLSTAHLVYHIHFCLSRTFLSFFKTFQMNFCDSLLISNSFTLSHSSVPVKYFFQVFSRHFLMSVYRSQATCLLYHMFVSLSTIIFVFFKTFQIVYSEETIPCDSLVRIPL